MIINQGFIGKTGIEYMKHIIMMPVEVALKILFKICLTAEKRIKTEYYN